VVWVTNGIYALTNEITIDRAVTVRSIDIPSRLVTVNGGAAHRCFSLNHSNAFLAGFVITNGFHAAYGGGVEISGGGVSNCLITGNRVAVNTRYSYGGGGVDCYLSGQLLNCDIVGNTVSGTNYPTGGGVLCQGSAVLVRQCTIERNRVLSPFTNGLGGGAQGTDGVAVERCSIRGNTVQGIGGGICCAHQVSISDGTISSNSASLSGGGFYIQTGPCPSLRVASFKGTRPVTWEAEALYFPMGSCWILSLWQTAPATSRSPPPAPGGLYLRKGEAPATARWQETRPLPEPAAFSR